MHVACAQNPAPRSDMALKLPDNLRIVEGSTEVLVGRLTVVSATQAQEQLLNNDSEIAGYPIANRAHLLKREQRQSLKKIILKDEHYITAKGRCLNDDFLGIRFNQGDKKVEFALGLPCHQVVWAYPTQEGARLWGGILNREASRQILLTVGWPLE